MAYETKVYIVQKADKNGFLGELLAVKLTFAAAHAVALRNAPAKVHYCVADKTDDINIGSITDQRRRCS